MRATEELLDEIQPDGTGGGEELRNVSSETEFLWDLMFPHQPYEMLVSTHSEAYL